MARHVGQRLILIGDGHGLVEGADIDDEQRLRRLLGEFAQVHVLTPTPENCWEERERRLLQSGFNVAFCDRQGIEDTARISTLVDWIEPLTAAIRNIRGDPDPFLAHLESEHQRYVADYPVLQPAEGAPDGPIATTGLSALQIRALVSALQAWMGSRPALRLLVAIALFPSVKPAYTFAIADELSRDEDEKVRGAKLDERLYARLARLPWLRDGRFPDWLRLALVRRLTDAEREAVARAHVKLLAPMAVARGDVLAQASLEIARKRLRANMDPDHPFAERLFLAMVFGEPPKADLLRPKASTAITERLGDQRKLAPRIVGSGFLVVAVLCFLFKDQVVFPALAAAERLARDVVYPRLPEGWIATLSVGISIVGSLMGLYTRTAGTRFFFTIASTNAAQERPFRWTRLVGAAATGVVYGVLSFKATELGALPLTATMFALVTLVSLALEQHPGWNRQIRVIPDIDEMIVSDEAPAKYPLGEAIASQTILRPTLAAAALLILASLVFACMLSIGMANWLERAIATSWLVPLAVVLAGGSLWTIFAAVLRQCVLGNWLLTDAAGTQRHLLTDFFTGAMSISIAFVVEQIGSLADSLPVLVLVGVPALVGLALLLITDALGLRPFAKPASQDDRVRANIAVAPLTSAIAVAVAALVALAEPPVEFFAVALMVIIIVQFVVSIVLVPISGVSMSRRERLGLALYQIRASGGLAVHAAFVLTLPLQLWIVADLLGNKVLVQPAVLSWAMLLTFWPMLRVFGPVPLIEGLKARQSGQASVRKPIFQWSYLETPWIVTAVLLALSLPSWRSLINGDLGPERLNWIVIVPCICAVAALRYGRAALWPVGLGLLPFVVGGQNKGAVIHGEPALVVAMLFWMRFIADATLRRALLARETLPLTDLLVLATAFAFTVTIYLPGGNGLILSYDPDWLVLTAAFVIGLSRMPAWRFLLLLGLLAILRAGIDLTALAPSQLDRTLEALGRAVPPKGSLHLLLYGLPWTTAVAASGVMLLARMYLRKAMLIDSPDSSPRGSAPFVSKIASAIFSARTPLILFLLGQIAWLEGLVFSRKGIVIFSQKDLFAGFLFDGFAGPLAESIGRSPIAAFTGLMLGLSVKRFGELMNTAFVILFFAAQFWLFLIIFVSAPPSGVFSVSTALESFLPAYAISSLLGLGLRAFAEGRWRLWTSADAKSAARAEWRRVLRWLSGEPRQLEQPSETAIMGSDGPIAGSRAEHETVERNPDPSPDGETASRPTKKARKK
ncbi:hypothetical protein QA641_23715 [Bradyrhizobium sp. CB1650]|uniref:hypothetical protein n=1 Tax=Bradyrhizobium sp. CB1650 TaxID=3039153 RepID=UPI0024353611|nr:hypothetical protein [Bradyrhizobium sp. CB1650]WGD48660.1 hypothetical protein QA641_23715 [Bradyrhizobium sp. CB1650]